MNGTLIDNIFTKKTFMKLESKKTIVNKSAQDTFNFLNKIENFEALMPENISKFEVLDSDKFLFALKGMPEIVLKRKDVIEPSQIVLGAAGGKLDFSLTANITELEANKSEVQLLFAGDFNAMMAMMIKGPISKFIDTLAENMPKAI